MRMLLKINTPAEKGSEAFKSGAMKRTFEKMIKELKPEAVYFFPEDGKRTALMVFDMKDSSQLPAIVEPVVASLGADFYFTPVMTPKDLERGFKDVEL